MGGKKGGERRWTESQGLGRVDASFSKVGYLTSVGLCSDGAQTAKDSY